MVATLLADKLGINTIIVPPYQGVFSAFGMLATDFQKEFSRSFLKRYTPQIREELDEAFSQMSEEALSTLKKEGFSEKKCEIQKFLESYANQPVGMIIGQRDYAQMPLFRRTTNTFGRWMISLDPRMRAGLARMLGRHGEPDAGCAGKQPVIQCWSDDDADLDIWQHRYSDGQQQRYRDDRLCRYGTDLSDGEQRPCGLQRCRRSSL